jgi:hypothetical protein
LQAIRRYMELKEQILFGEFMTGLLQVKFLKSGGVAALLLSGLVTSAHAQGAPRDTQQQACSRDVSRHCRRQMNDGDSAIYQCLIQNREKLSPSCRKLVEGH